jgi:hypothetical protein
MIDLVFVVWSARHDHRESQCRVIAASVAPFGRSRAFRPDEQVALRLAAHHHQVEALVGLLVDQAVVGSRRTHHVRLHAPAEQRHRVLFDVEQRPVVVRPGHVSFDVLDDVGK